MLINWAAERKRAGLSQTELADLMKSGGFDFYQSTVYKIESGKRQVEFSEGFYLCELLGVDINSRRDLHVII